MAFDISPGMISLKTVFLSTTIAFFTGIAAAYWMRNYNGKFKSIIDTVFTLPLVLPPTVVGFFLLVAFGRYSLLGKFLSMFGKSLIFSWWAAVIASSVVAFPLMYRTTKGAFEQIDSNIINAARTLGVKEWRIFTHIVIPMARPGIAAAAVLCFSRALGEFGATLMVAGNIPGKTQTIPLAIYFAAENGEMGTALVWVLMIIGISTIVIFCMNYWNEHVNKNIYGSR